MKSETGQGLSYSVSQEADLRAFLDHGDILRVASVHDGKMRFWTDPFYIDDRKQLNFLDNCQVTQKYFLLH